MHFDVKASTVFDSTLAGSLRGCTHEDILSVVCGYLPKEDIEHLSQVNHLVRDNMIQGVADKFEAIFGRNENVRQNIYDTDERDLRELMDESRLSIENPLDVYTRYKAPKSWKERMLWLSGAENELDKTVYGAYQRRKTLLENTTFQSPLQLSHQMRTSFHEDSRLDEYERFKKREKMYNLISLLFFKYIYSFFSSSHGLPLQTSKTESAQSLQIGRHKLKSSVPPQKIKKKRFTQLIPIGQFKISDVEYKAYAKHEGSNTQIYVQNQRRRVLYCFCTCMGRLKEVRKPNDPITYDDFIGERTFDENKKEWSRLRYLVFFCGRDFGTLSVDSQRSETGSNRHLDQKITQILIEIMKQNKVLGGFGYSFSPNASMVLVAAGFENKGSELSIKRQIVDFRANHIGKLFPPYEEEVMSWKQFMNEQWDDDSTDDSTTVKQCNLAARNIDTQPVLLSGNDSDTLADIINREPILYPGAAALPDAWVKKLPCDKGPDVLHDDDYKQND